MRSTRMVCVSAFLAGALGATALGGEWVVDNDAGAPGYTETGAWTTSASPGYLNGTYRYVIVPGAAASATWRPTLPQSRMYSVYAIYRQGSNRTTSAPMTITHTSGTTVVRLNQNDPASAMVETFLGDYWFGAGSAGSVRMDSGGEPGAYIADAIAWRTPTDPPPSIATVTRSPVNPTSSDSVVVTATITDRGIISGNGLISSAALHFRTTPPGTNAVVQAFDDGAHDDAKAGDGIYGALMPPQPDATTVRLYYSAWDDAGQETSSPVQTYVTGRQGGNVYVVVSSDTSVWGFSSGPTPTIPWTVFESRTGAVAKVYAETFRNSHCDSLGKPFTITWFMHGGAWFRAAVNSTPVSATYHFRKNWGDAIARWNDALEYHFHHYVYTTDWVQAPTFAETIWEYEAVMSQMMLDEHLFIAAFRSGWNYMDDPYQQYLERWVPFRMEGVQSNWLAYHPSTANWKTPGTMKGWEARHIYTKSLSQSIANAAFSAANQGADQVMCVWSHQNEDDYPEQIDAVDKLLHAAAEAYPAVQFHYLPAREAMRRFTGNAADTNPPPLQAVPAISGDQVTVHITTDDGIYQEEPWVAARKYDGEYLRLGTVKTGTGTWQFAYSRTEYDRVAVGATDINGNDALAEVDDGSRRWAVQSEFAASLPFQADCDSSPTRVWLAKAGGAFLTTGTLTFDHALSTPGQWKSVILAGNTPPGTQLRFRYKTAAAPTQFGSAPWSGYHPVGTLVMPPGASDAHIRVEVLLEGTPSATPELLSLEVTYEQPVAGLGRDTWRLY